MHLARAVATAVASIAAGQQAEQLLPTDFCTPECRESSVPLWRIRRRVCGPVRGELIFYR